MQRLNSAKARYFLALPLNGIETGACDLGEKTSKPTRWDRSAIYEKQAEINNPPTEDFPTGLAPRTVQGQADPITNLTVQNLYRKRSFPLRHGTEARYEFLEYRAYWHGRFNRSDLITQFGVSQTQASMDFKAYQDLAPGNLVYDGTERTYRPSDRFRPLFFQISADSYLMPLLSLAAGAVEPSGTWLKTIPEFHVSPMPARGVSPEVLRSIVRGLEYALAVEVLYQSMSAPEPGWRWIEPHALAHDGFRWHVRAFCQRSGTFKDFVLSRILDVRTASEKRHARSTPADDAAWHSTVTLQICPHPALSQAQRTAIRQDYGMDEAGLAEITVRKSMLYYTLKRFGLDTDPEARRPQDQQIVLANAAEVFAHLGRTET